MRSGEFYKIATKLDPSEGAHIRDAAVDAFTQEGERKEYGPDFYIELYPYLVLFGEQHKSIAPTGDNEAALGSQMKSLKSRLASTTTKEKYRASFLGWLSQLHPERFYALVEERDLGLKALTTPIDLMSLPEFVAKAHTDQKGERDERLKRIGWTEPSEEPIPKTQHGTDAVSELISTNKAAVPDDIISAPPKATSSLHSRADQDKQRTEELHSGINKRSSKYRRSIVLAGLVVLAFVSVGTLSIIGSSSIQGPDTETIGMSTNERHETSVIDSVEVPVPGTDPSSNEQFLDQTEEAEALVEDLSYDPVWDEITDVEWSLKQLRYFYKFINQADKESLNQAALSKNPNAMTLQAIGLHVGILKSENSRNEAIELLQSACDLQQGRACMLLGWLHEKGVGIIKNEARGLSLYEQACNLKIAQGCWYAGSRTYGEGQKSGDYRRSFENHRKGCELGLPITCNWSAYMTFLGYGTQMNEEVALEYWRKDGTTQQSEEEYRASMLQLRAGLRASGKIPE